MKIADSILPMKIKDLIDRILKSKNMDLESAIFYLYSSKLCSDLHNDNLKLWYQSSDSLYDLLELEKLRNRFSLLNLSEKEILFCAFCIENYIIYKKANQKSMVLEEFSKYGVYAFLINNYEMLHSQDVAYIMDSIESYIRNRR